MVCLFPLKTKQCILLTPSTILTRSSKRIYTTIPFPFPWGFFKATSKNSVFLYQLHSYLLPKSSRSWTGSTLIFPGSICSLVSSWGANIFVVLYYSAVCFTIALTHLSILIPFWSKFPFNVIKFLPNGPNFSLPPYPMSRKIVEWSLSMSCSLILQTKPLPTRCWCMSNRRPALTLYLWRWYPSNVDQYNAPLQVSSWISSQMPFRILCIEIAVNYLKDS